MRGTRTTPVATARSLRRRARARIRRAPGARARPAPRAASTRERSPAGWRTRSGGAAARRCALLADRMRSEAAFDPLELGLALRCLHRHSAERAEGELAVGRGDDPLDRIDSRRRHAAVDDV